MTRKDYVLIADALARAQWVGEPPLNVEHPAAFLRGYKQALLSAAVKVANDLAADNARFDRERFLKAAGVTP